MSTLEKAIILLQEMPEQSVETVYTFMQSLKPYPNQNRHSGKSPFSTINEDDTAELVSSQRSSLERRQKGFQGLMSFAGTLPEDFDYKKELEEARNEKYARFI